MQMAFHNNDTMHVEHELYERRPTHRGESIIGSATRYRPIFVCSAIGPVSDADAEYTVIAPIAKMHAELQLSKTFSLPSIKMSIVQTTN